MSIEKDLTRIADALEKIAEGMRYKQVSVSVSDQGKQIAELKPVQIEPAKPKRTAKPELKPEVAKPAAKPEAAQTAPSIDKARELLKAYAIANGKDAARALIAKHGAASVSSLTPEQMTTMINELENGAQDDDFTS